MRSIAARALAGTARQSDAEDQPPAMQDDGVSEAEQPSLEESAHPETVDEDLGFEEDPLASSMASSVDDPAESAEQATNTAIEEVPYIEEDTPFDDDYENVPEGEYVEEDGESSFEYRAPFTSRRNPLKMWTAAAALFALMAIGTVGAVNYYGLPEWLPFPRPTFGAGQTDLELEFPAAQQREEVLANGETIFRVRGTITNSGRETLSVPSLVVVFLNERNQEVFSKVVQPSKSELAPGESLKVTEGIADLPETAAEAQLGWSPE